MVDIVGFTKLSSKLTPFEVVSFLNDIFRIFDDVRIPSLRPCCPFLVYPSLSLDRELLVYKF